MSDKLDPQLLKAGVIGWPISHSLSPRLHGFWLDAFQINGTYEAIPVKPKDLNSFVKSLKTNGYQGVNVTIPHKETIMEFCDTLSDVAIRVGAVNTLTVSDKGLISGTNTDVYGFSENLKQSKAWKNHAKGPAVVLGAGGAARGICVALQDMGYTDIRLVNRTIARAETLADDLGGGISIYAMANVSESLKAAQLLVNTTSLGMKGALPLEIDLTNLPKSAIVNDIVYNPLETNLLKQAGLRGNPTVNGIGMLLYQAVPGFMAWFKPDENPQVNEKLRRHVLKAIQ